MPVCLAKAEVGSWTNRVRAIVVSEMTKEMRASTS